MSVPFLAQPGSNGRKTGSFPNGANKEANDGAAYRGMGAAKGVGKRGASSLCPPQGEHGGVGESWTVPEAERSLNGGAGLALWELSGRREDRR